MPELNLESGMPPVAAWLPEVNDVGKRASALRGEPSEQEGRRGLSSQAGSGAWQEKRLPNECAKRAEPNPDHGRRARLLEAAASPREAAGAEAPVHGPKTGYLDPTDQGAR